MDSDAIPSSRFERVYATVIAVVVPLFFVAIWFASYFKNGTFDSTLMKKESLFFLAYIGSIAVAIWIGSVLLTPLTKAIRNDLLRSGLRFGLPLFLITSAFNLTFPSHISFTEHTAVNLPLAFFVTWYWRDEQRGRTESEG